MQTKVDVFFQIFLKKMKSLWFHDGKQKTRQIKWY